MSAWRTRVAAFALAAAVVVPDPASAVATPDAVPSPASTVGAVAPESPVAITAKAEPDTVTIGTRFRYTVEIVAPPGFEVVMTQPTERLGEFDIVDFGDVPRSTRDGATVLGRWYTLVGFEPGHKLVPTPPVRYRAPGGELTEIPSREIVVTVESVLARAGDAKDIRDIKPPEEPPVDWRPYYIIAAAVAVLVALVLLVTWLLRRRRRAEQAAAPRPPHEIAREELDRLWARGLITVGAFKEYYSALSAIVRLYIERRFGVRAPEMTTEEFLLATARSGRLEPAHRTLLGEFLTESDLVKFARHLPTIADCERAYASARRFVDETAAPEAADPGGSGTEAAAADAHEGRRRAAG